MSSEVDKDLGNEFRKRIIKIDPNDESGDDEVLVEEEDLKAAYEETNEFEKNDTERKQVIAPTYNQKGEVALQTTFVDIARATNINVGGGHVKSQVFRRKITNRPTGRSPKV
jgi:hypothetical protein